MTDSVSATEVPWGPTGRVVYERTYSRKRPDGTNEDWPDTVKRVVDGNLALVYGPDPALWSNEVQTERARLMEFMLRFGIIPAGRHLWASGVRGRQYLFNCHVAGWGEDLSRHFDFTFMRLMEGGGVGANYSSAFLKPYGAPRRALKVHIVCDPSHADYEELRPFLSEQYDSDWPGSFGVEDSREGWAAALVDLIDTYMTDDEVKHENRVYDVTNVRPRGSRLKTFGGTASGPAPFARMMLEVERVMNEAEQIDGGGAYITPLMAMEIDHAIAECVVSGGVRRSARMAMLPWDDPYIFDFIACKRDTGKHWTTNISVEVDDDFMGSLSKDPECEDADNGCKICHANAVHEAVVTGMLTNGEPGYWNSSLSNVGEPNRVIATNPCGEIALEAWENCNLGHVNLDAFAPTRKGGPADMLGLIEAHRLMTRFLIRATYGDVTDDGQAEVLRRNRRIGVGHFGVQGFWAKRGVPYSGVPRTPVAHRFLREMYDVVRKEARDYAFELRIPEPVKVTTVAPTGSIAKLPGVSEGIGPIYARYFERRVRFSYVDAEQSRTVNEAGRQGFRVELDQYDSNGNTAIVVYPTKDSLVEQVEAMGWPADVVESADEISLRDMLAFQEMYQQCWADNAVSMTVNVPADRYDAEIVEAVLAAFLPTLKGTTIMVDESRAQAPYTRISEAEYEAAAAKVVEDGTDEECANGSCPIR